MTMRIAIAIALLASLASAQCCLGAQNGESVSDNGRYRVRATSQTGTGPTSHGPYRFTFTFDEKNEAGAWIQRGAMLSAAALLVWRGIQASNGGCCAE